MLTAIILLVLSLFSVVFSRCDRTIGDNISFTTKIENSPYIVYGMSMNKITEQYIPNLFNVTFRVDCILKGKPMDRIINIIQAGGPLLGRKFCQDLDAGREYIVFIERFFDVFRPIDFQEIKFDDETAQLLEKTCSLARIQPLRYNSSVKDQCPTVSANCATDSKMDFSVSIKETSTIGSTHEIVSSVQKNLTVLLSNSLGKIQLKEPNDKSLFSDINGRSSASFLSSNVLFVITISIYFIVKN
ncbi:unnamed protein product [Didymodactylos carnosus]|uniref:Uncharacterized protein n=2 Tax=Didymodactylos carnosus TaxID=1234261 RepID=A0A815D4C9_9BILA|nr:unnamed protein product [Didymodactylos carnosus]CAF4092634.1 unnamed protein product [Didymodactylos carnosus]